MSDVQINKMKEILTDVQHHTSNHTKNLRKLHILFEQTDYDKFVDQFAKCLATFLVDKSTIQQNSYVDKGIQFCTSFITSFYSNNDEQTNPFLNEILIRILQLSNIPSTRHRVCSFINLTLQQLGDRDASLDDNICDQIRDAMLERTMDIKPAIQIQAIEVLQKLQDPHDPDDPIVKAFIKCTCDSNRQVRKSATRCIGLSVYTMPILLKSCFDVDESMRYAAYERISKLNFKALKIEQRQQVLSRGLTDKSNRVKAVVEDSVLPFWLSNCNDNYFQFIDSLRLDADEQDWKQSTEIIELVLGSLFKKSVLKDTLEFLPLGQDKLLTTIEKRWTEKIYWRCLVNFLHKNEDLQDFFDEVLPDLSIFCDYIHRVYKTRPTNALPFDLLEHDQIMYELLQMVELFDFSDEIGRKNVLKLITDWLTAAELSFDAVDKLVKIYTHLVPSSDERFRDISNIVFDIRNPLVVKSPPKHAVRQRDVKLAELNVKLNVAVDEQEQAIVKKDFMAAEKLKHVIVELKEQVQHMQGKFVEAQVPVREGRIDVITLCKCLDILILALQLHNLNSIPNAIRTVHEDFVQPLTMSSEPEIYKRVMHFYGLISTMDKVIAFSFIHLFTGQLLNYKTTPLIEEEKTLVAVTAITDILLLHGKATVGNDEPKKRSQKRQLFTESCINETATESDGRPVSMTLTEIIEILSTMLDDMNLNIREKACKSLIKLVYNDVFTSPMLLSKLILKWFNPATAKDIRILQLLGGFLTHYVMQVPSSLEVMEVAFVPTLVALVEAPKHSPLADIDILSVIKFLLEICRPSRQISNTGLDPYKNLSLVLCREICERPNKKCTLIFLKTLIIMNTPEDDGQLLNDLRRQTELMLEMIRDKVVLKYVHKYRNKLDGNASETVTEDVASQVQSEPRPETELNDSQGAECTDNRTTDNDPSDLETSLIIPIVDPNVLSTSDDHTDTSIDKHETYSRISVKRRKYRGRATRTKSMDEPVAGPSSAPDLSVIKKSTRNTKQRGNNRRNDTQVMLVQTDSDQEQPEPKTHVVETRARRSADKLNLQQKQNVLETKTPDTEQSVSKQKVNKKNVMKDGEKSMNESQVVLEQGDSNLKQNTQTKESVVHRRSLRKKIPRK